MAAKQLERICERGTQQARLTEATGGLLRVRVIDAGMGSSGYYPAEALEAAAKAKVFARGLHVYLDHPGDAEEADRPERTLRDLAGVLASDAVYRDGALEADVRVFTDFRGRIAEIAEHIGMSIRAGAYVEYGDVDGQNVPIIRELVSAESVDFVTRAGRGGAILQVLESARAAREQRIVEARNLGQFVESRLHREFTVMADDMAADGRLTRAERIALSGAIGDGLAAFVLRVEADAPQMYERDIWDQAGPVAEAARAVEATANDTREALHAALKEEFGAEDTYVWVRDFDESTVWFEVSSPESQTTFSLGFAIDDELTVTFDGAPTEVRVTTTYVPVAAEVDEAIKPPVIAAGTAPRSPQEDTMPQIEEARLRQLEEDAGRVTTLESERDTAVTERDAALEENATLRTTANTATAARIVGECFTAANINAPKLAARLAAGAPLAESGDVDEDALRTAVDEAIAELAEAGGAGTPRIGSDGKPVAEVSESDLDKTVAGAFGRTIKES